MRRHENEIWLRLPTGTSKAQAVGFNKETVDKFQVLLEQEYTKIILWFLELTMSMKPC